MNHNKNILLSVSICTQFTPITVRFMNLCIFIIIFFFNIFICVSVTNVPATIKDVLEPLPPQTIGVEQCENNLFSSIQLFVYLSIYISNYMSIYLFIYPTMRLSIYIIYYLTRREN